MCESFFGNPGLRPAALCDALRACSCHSPAVKKGAARNALNSHMAKHACGRPVAEPEIAIVAKAS